MKTYVANPADRERNWVVVDATGPPDEVEGRTWSAVAGRLAIMEG